MDSALKLKLKLQAGERLTDLDVDELLRKSDVVSRLTQNFDGSLLGAQVTHEK